MEENRQYREHQRQHFVLGKRLTEGKDGDHGSCKPAEGVEQRKEKSSLERHDVELRYPIHHL